MSLHDGEFSIDNRLVAELIHTQMPWWRHLPIERTDTAGTVNVIYRLGDDMVIRLPRKPDYSDGPERERRWMPVLASHLPLRVPRHLTLGQPTDAYPSAWSVLEWIEGETADQTSLSDLDEAAAALGRFVVALQAISTEDAPDGGSYRGFGLADVDQPFQHGRRGYPVTSIKQPCWLDGRTAWRQPRGMGGLHGSTAIFGATT